MTQVTVIRRIVQYEECVFNSEEEFEQWKSLSENDEWEEFNQFNKNNFKDIWYNTRLDINPDLYVALNGDQTQATDDWIFTGIFNEGNEVDQYNIETLELMNSESDTLSS